MIRRLNHERRGRCGRCGREQVLERRLVAGVLLARGRAGDEPAEAVDDEEHRIGQLWSRSARSRPQLDQQVFEPVGQAADPHHADHSGGAFHGVRLTKDRVDGSVIVRRRLQGEQP